MGSQKTKNKLVKPHPTFNPYFSSHSFLSSVRDLRNGIFFLTRFDSLEVKDNDEGEGDDERDDGGGDHEVERHLGVLVPGDGAPPGLLDHLAGVLVGEVVYLRIGQRVFMSMKVKRKCSTHKREKATRKKAPSEYLVKMETR